jgi:hypothetical protein
MTLTGPIGATRKMVLSVRKAMMEEDLNSYIEQEFRPLDEAQVEWLLDIATKVRDMAGNTNLTFEERNLMDVVAHQLVRLMSMTLAGFELYSLWNKIARLLRDEILAALEDVILNDAKFDLSQFPTVSEMFNNEVKVADDEY